MSGVCVCVHACVCVRERERERERETLCVCVRVRMLSECCPPRILARASKQERGLVRAEGRWGFTGLLSAHEIGW